jgi:hypothetical protein
VLSGDNKLVDITAFESPWGNNTRRSDWVITSIIPRERMIQAAASEPPTEDPASGDVTVDPSLAGTSFDEIPSF